MRLLQTLLFSIAAFWVVGYTISDVLGMGDYALAGACVAAVVTFAFFVNRTKPAGDISKAVGRAVTTMKSAKDAIESSVEVADAKLYAVAEREISEGKIDDGLWSFALVNANGDENVRKVEYMKLRVRQLKSESA